MILFNIAMSYTWESTVGKPSGDVWQLKGPRHDIAIKQSLLSTDNRYGMANSEATYVLSECNMYKGCEAISCHVQRFSRTSNPYVLDSLLHPTNSSQLASCVQTVSCNFTTEWLTIKLYCAVKLSRLGHTSSLLFITYCASLLVCRIDHININGRREGHTAATHVYV